MRNDGKKHTCLCGEAPEDILVPVLEKGRYLEKPEPAAKLRKRVLEEVRGIHENG